jgi:hypothetical protein
LSSQVIDPLAMERAMKPTIYAPALVVATLAARGSLELPSGYQPLPSAEDGKTADPSAGGTADLVVRNDFHCAKPLPIPE